MKRPEAQVVQIGSNDGRTADPVYMLMKRHRHWRGLFVEPVPYLFDRLRKNYGSDRRFKFECAVIGDGTESEFYWVDKSAKDAIPNLPAWYDQIASFQREHILKHLDGVLEPFIVSKRLKSLTLNDLLHRHQITQLDLLHIDAEGNDWRILSQLDLSVVAPELILFEEVHLDEESRRLARRFLEPRYHLFSIGDDMLAVRKDSALCERALPPELLTLAVQHR